MVGEIGRERSWSVYEWTTKAAIPSECSPAELPVPPGRARYLFQNPKCEPGQSCGATVGVVDEAWKEHRRYAMQAV
jgi:hypothetical protein